MSAPLDSLADLTISAGGTTSDVGGTNGSTALAITAPSALTGVVTVEVEQTSTGNTWGTLQSGGVDVTIAASKTLTIFPTTFARFRLTSSAAEAANRSFKCARLGMTR